MENSARSKRRSYVWAAIYAIALVGYAVFTLLDAFVLPKNMVQLPTATAAATTESNTSSSLEATTAPPVVTATSYESEGISISITTLREYDTQIYAAQVIIKDPSYLKAGLAEGAFGRNVNATTSAMAEQNGAILAINGDYYGFRDKGYVMRNGYLYRESARAVGDDEALVIDNDGHMQIVNENDTPAQQLAENARQIFSFGPALIRDSALAVYESSEVEQAMRSNPRTAIGELSPLHYVFVVSDGRNDESEGLTLLQLAQVMQGLGCETAYNLDGGGSSTMWFMGSVVNNPTNGWRGGERSVSDIVYIGE